MNKTLLEVTADMINEESEPSNGPELVEEWIAARELNTEQLLSSVNDIATAVVEACTAGGTPIATPTGTMTLVLSGFKLGFEYARMKYTVEEFDGG